MASTSIQNQSSHKSSGKRDGSVSTSSSTGGGGLFGLLRSARKSTESLRSTRSSTSIADFARRKSLSNSVKQSRAWIPDQELDPPPPLPSSKDSTGSYSMQSRPSASHSVYSTSSQSLASLPSEAYHTATLPNTGSRTHAKYSSDSRSAREASNKPSRSENLARQDIEGTHLTPRTMEQLPRPSDQEDSLPPLPSEMWPRNRTTSGAADAASISSNGSSLRSRTRSTKQPCSRGMMTVPSRNEARYEDGAKTPTPDGRTTPTQSDPFGRAGYHPSASNNAKASSSKEGDGNTVAQLYAVFGLPKDPSVWTLAEEDCVAGVQHMEGAVGRFWRPEVLGCSICPSPTELFARQNGAGDGAPEKKWEARSADGKKNPNNPKFIEMADGRGRIEKAETARVLSKALKLSFTREIEIVSGQSNYPPMASSHTFSFSVPTLSSSSGEPLERGGLNPASVELRKGTGAVGVSHSKASAATGEGYGVNGSGLPASANAGFEESSAPATFYGVVLTVWSAADERRAKAIKRELSRAAKARSGKDKKSLDEDVGFLPANNAFFMPYAICIVSRYPLYDLLGDWNKWAWHKYSRNIEMHNKLMSTILAKPAPRLGETFVVESPDGDLAFSCTFPGALEWGTGLIGIDFTMWPLFKTLSVDNILTICEIALAPNGRVLFSSRHPALLGLAVETIKYLVELRGWQGIANQNCHARDVKIYLEDPGTWLIAISTELRSIVKPAREVCTVDLDINFVHCANPPPGAPSTKGLREKRKKKLFQALGYTTGDFRPPREFVEAYPGGRFRPMSKMHPRAQHIPYEQLEQPIWWDQARVIAGFDKTLHDGSRPSAFAKLLRMRAAKNRTTSEAELAAILALRKRASTFVDARDGLENKIGRLNKRLAFLMSESEMWKAQFTKIQQLVDRLTREANETRAKLDKERRESRRLSSTLAQRDMERVQLQVQLKETETAREEAQAELLAMQKAMDSLEQEREAMMDEIRGIISGAGGDDVAFNMSRFDLYHESVGHGSSRAASPTNSQVSMTPSQAAERILKARRAAEDRINEGRPSSRGSRSRRGHGNSSVGHGKQASPPASSAGGNHFPEDQMNYEIQQRTSSVTDQIARIQAQLEDTLSHLEDRRGHGRRTMRARRDSDLSSSASHMRYEYRTPSSIGGSHRGDTGTGDDSEFDYDSQSQEQSVHGGYGSSVSASGYGSDIARRERRERRRRREGASGGNASESHRGDRRNRANNGPPSAYRGPSGPMMLSGTSSTSGGPATASGLVAGGASSNAGSAAPAQNGSTEGANGHGKSSSTASTNSSHASSMNPAQGPRVAAGSNVQAQQGQTLQERENVNPWKTATGGPGNALANAQGHTPPSLAPSNASTYSGTTNVTSLSGAPSASTMTTSSSVQDDEGREETKAAGSMPEKDSSNAPEPQLKSPSTATLTSSVEGVNSGETREG